MHQEMTAVNTFVLVLPGSLCNVIFLKMGPCNVNNFLLAFSFSILFVSDCLRCYSLKVSFFKMLILHSNGSLIVYVTHLLFADPLSWCQQRVDPGFGSRAWQVYRHIFK